MFACNQVVKLTWSIGGQRGGSGVHGTDIPGYTHLDLTGDVYENSSSQLSSDPDFLVR